MGNKAITIRITESMYEKFCVLATENDELLSETIRNILRKYLAGIEEDSKDKAIYLKKVS